MADSRSGKSASVGPVVFGLLSVAIGIVAGLGAVVFRGMIALFHNLLFFHHFSLSYDANVHTSASPWGLWVIAVPVLGAAGVVFLVKNFAPETKGPGVRQVMDASVYHKGVIRPVVAVIKAVASALSIGSGASLGREGPIIQIGASFGSTLAQWLRLSTWQRVTMVSAGAAGGIGATFNTPLGGILFAVELMLQEMSVRTIVPVILSTVTATYVGRLFFGDHPSFIIPRLQTFKFYMDQPLVFIAYIGLGVLLGGLSVLFIRSIYGFEDFWQRRIPGNYYLRHMTGMLIVGIMMYIMMVAFGHYYIQGVGYATVQDVLTSRLTLFGLLLLLFVLKLFATSLTLGSGASGGIFSPALFMGATFGAAYGIGLGWIFPEIASHAPAFAVAGMAGLVGGSTGAAIAAILMIFEMTSDYQVVIPMAITVAVAYMVRRMLLKESIYTLNLVRKGHYMPDALHTNVVLVKRAGDVMSEKVGAISGSNPIKQCAEVVGREPDISLYIISENDRIIGVITSEAILERLRRGDGRTPVRDHVRRDYVVVSEATTFRAVMERVKSVSASIVLVATRDDSQVAADIKGAITKDQIIGAVAGSLELYSD